MKNKLKLSLFCRIEVTYKARNGRIKTITGTIVHQYANYDIIKLVLDDGSREIIIWDRIISIKNLIQIHKGQT